MQNRKEERERDRELFWVRVAGGHGVLLRVFPCVSIKNYTAMNYNYRYVCERPLI